MLLRVDSNDSVQNSFDIKKVDFDSYDAVVVADYDKGFLTNDDIKKIGEKAKLSFIDTKKTIDLKHFKGYTFVKMNEVEWERCERYGAKYEDWKKQLIVTMSERGCMFNGRRFEVDNTVEVRDLSGAGDTWMASFAFKFTQNSAVNESIKFANDNATLVVQKRGVTTI
jgi:D-beta-D-heptose 7-phosphate kinase/D-beta-D-heptose 1-phosphate adenosyltransferase